MSYIYIENEKENYSFKNICLSILEIYQKIFCEQINEIEIKFNDCDEATKIGKFQLIKFEFCVSFAYNIRCRHFKKEEDEKIIKVYKALEEFNELNDIINIESCNLEFEKIYAKIKSLIN
ncbi:hypothetical protein GVAV_003447 [Gurleya vavrai]